MAEALGLQRNAASALLNELAREGFLRKQKTKPVIFTREEKEEEGAAADQTQGSVRGGYFCGHNRRFLVYGADAEPL